MPTLEQMIRTHPKAWTRELLLACSANDLQGLCRLLDIPHRGPKTLLAGRLMDAAVLRIILGPFEYDEGADRDTQIAQVQRLADSYNARFLHALCRTAGVFPASTKYGKAAGLLEWRNRCRRNGQRLWEESRTAAREHVHTRAMPLGAEVAEATHVARLMDLPLSIRAIERDTVAALAEADALEQLPLFTEEEKSEAKR